MAPMVALAMLMFSMTSHAICTWCVCKDMQNAALQNTLDYACGAGADCGPIQQNGPCFSPNNVRAHCSYAVNSLFQRRSQATGTCDFSGTATTSTTDPSITGCPYPATLSAAAGTSTPPPITTTPASGTSTPPPITTTPASGTSTPPPITTTPASSNSTPSTSGMTPSTTSPYTTTPSGGILGGGINGGFGPQVEPNNDYDNNTLRILPTTTAPTLLLIYGMAMLVMSRWV